MNKDGLFSFYERIYFHEMETREKLFTRIQISFALFFTGYSIASYMVRMLDFTSHKSVATAFVVLTIVSGLISLVGVRHLVIAFWGSVYKGMSSPAETDKYRQDVQEYASSIVEYNNQYPDNKQPLVDLDDMVSQFVFEQLRDCASHNTKVNDSRFAHVHNSIRWLLVAIIPFAIASALFVSFDLDASSPRKETLIHNRSLVEEVDKLSKKIVQAVSQNQDFQEVQKQWLQNQNQVLYHLHQVLQQHQSHEELLKMVNHQNVKGQVINVEQEKSTTTAATK
ncbi:hypothetical protein [Vibrio splendidus]|uniref:hypothetical protein n=1 Tax=Vibrio splendidus TaxID=29497 RepID=UPI000D34F5C9|nr:hypothetical protein [Vibrio splendidus]PTO74856.1 hypothetical protein CWN84_16140 [Vibrio splendidus]